MKFRAKTMKREEVNLMIHRRAVNCLQPKLHVVEVEELS